MTNKLMAQHHYANTGMTDMRQGCLKNTYQCVSLGVTLVTLLSCGGGGGSSTPAPIEYTLTANVSGLDPNSSGLTLQNMWRDDLTIDSNGSHTFATHLLDSEKYFVTIQTQPTAPAQACTIKNRSGTIATADVANVVIDCGPLQSILYKSTDNIAYEGLSMVGEDGSNQVDLATSPDQMYLSTVFKSPSGRVVYTYGNTNGDTDVKSVWPDGSDTQIIAATAGDETAMQVSTTGRVLFTNNDSSSGTGMDVFSDNDTGTDRIVLMQTTDDEQISALTPGDRVILSRRIAGAHELFSVNPDGTLRARLTNTPDDEMYRDSTATGYVIFQRKPDLSQSELYSVAQDGSAGEAALAVQPGHNTYEASTTDGVVVYSHETASGQYDLYAVNASGALPAVTLADDPNVDEFFLTLLPDNRIIFRIEDGDVNLFAVNPDGTNLTPLGNTADSEIFSGVTRDGRILFTRETNGFNRDLFIINADGSNEVRLTNTPDDEFIADERLVNLTPDGRIIFYCDRADGLALCSAKHDGSDYRVLTDPVDPAWRGVTRGGRLILEIYSLDTNLYSMRADGSDLRMLTDSALSDRFYLFYD